jgi:hypothetical protein
MRLPALTLAMGLVVCASGLPLVLLDTADFRRLAQNQPIVAPAATPLANFYGRLVNSNAETATTNFTGITSSGSSSFAPNSTDFANIYHAPNDYDTWRQSVPVGASTGHFLGSFTVQYANATDGSLCAVLELSWGMSINPDRPPEYHCDVKIVALEFDCHTSWGISAECTFNATLNEVYGVWNVVNLGPDDAGVRAYVVHKQGENPPAVFTMLP